MFENSENVHTKLNKLHISYVHVSFVMKYQANVYRRKQLKLKFSMFTFIQTIESERAEFNRF